MARKLIRVFPGRDNRYTLVFSVDGALADGNSAHPLAAVTRYLLLGEGLSIDSDEEPGVFDTTAAAAAELRLQLGLLASPPPTGDYTAVRLITFDPDNPNGVVWDAELHLRFGP